MNNKRINNRFVLHQLIEICYPKEETFYSAKTIDISVGGIRCEVKYPIKSSSEIYLMFEIKGEEDSHLIKCYGESTWTTRENDIYIVGIEFKDLDDEDKVILEQYLQTLDAVS